MELKFDRYRVLAVPPIFVREKWKFGRSGGIGGVDNILEWENDNDQ